MRDRIAVALCTFALGWSVPSVAQEAEESNGFDELEDLDDLDDLDGVGSSSSGVQGKGYGALEFVGFVADRDGDRNDQNLFFDVQLELDAEIGAGFAFYTNLRWFGDFLDPDLLRFEPLEAYFSYYAEGFDIRVGQFIDSWGIADVYNPLDILNRRDLGPNALDPVPLGELGIKVRMLFDGSDAFGEPTLSLYFMPLPRDPLYPTHDNRFALRSDSLELADRTAEQSEYPDALFGAARFEHTLNTRPFNADFQYVVAVGPARFPTFGVRPQASGVTGIVAQNYGEVVAGGGFRAVPNHPTLGRVTLKAEVVYHFPYELDPPPDALPDEYLQYVAGFDAVFSDAFVRNDQLTWTLEYAGESLADDLNSDFRIFDRDVATRLYWEVNDAARNTLELRAAVDVASAETVAELIYKVQVLFISESLSLELAGQWIRADPDGTGFLSFFPDNSNARARLQYDF